MNDTDSAKVTSQNWRTRQRLKLSLSLGLRRQIFIAVCDNLRLKDEIVKELGKELGHPTKPEQISLQGYPKLVTLNLNLDNPNILLQIAQWLKQHPLPANANPQHAVPPSFQFLGIDLLTGQPGEVQQTFLRHLLAVERHLPQLESNLLLWVSRSWLHLIRQSVPEFWRWHTSVFWFQRDSLPELPPDRYMPVQENLGNNNFDYYRQEHQNNQTPVHNNHNHTNNTAANHTLALTQLSRERQEEETSSVLSPLKTTVQLEAELSTPEPDHIYSLQEIAQLQQQSVAPAFIAEAYLQLGDYHRDRVAEGEKTTENLTTSIQAYTMGLQWMDDEDSRIPEILNDKGNLYWMLSRQPKLMNEASLYLEQAVESYQLALGQLTPLLAPQTYGMIQNNLGAAYNDLSRYQETAANLQLAIESYHEALNYRSVAADAQKYASTQNNLGTAYWHLAQQQEPINNLQAAIASYQESLAQYQPEQDAISWAMVQNNLGTAYWNLAQYEEPEKFLQFAINAYKNSLQYRTQETEPIACAATQNNLGTTYWHLGAKFTEESQTQQKYFQQAIAAYNIAITIAERLSLLETPVAVNFDVLVAKNNLGLVHYQLATDPHFYLEENLKRNHLEAALQAHLQALQDAIPETDVYKNTFNYIVNTIRTFYKDNGIEGQNHALSQVPGALLPGILPLL